jgi:hypothetical protein
MNSVAEDLSTTRFRYLNDVQIGALRRKYGVTRDEVRSAAIMADRIRRHRQAEEQRNSFRLELVAIDAPIVLKAEQKPSKRKHERWGRA